MRSEYERYRELTRKALEKVRIAVPERSFLREVAEDFLRMARAYLEDAEHFAGEGDYLRAVGAVYYAHAWLDAGARLGIFDVEEDEDLFTLYR